MPLFSGLQILPPANWQDFETLCCDLWRAIWKDPNTQKNGRQGQSQHGVDIYGRPNQEDLWAGVQCKGKNNYTNKSLAEKEVRDEVENAKSFEPKLSHFIIATTGPKDAKIEELARKITDEHSKSGLFSVNVLAWNDIKDRLEDFPDIINKHYPGLSLNTEAFKKQIDKIAETTQAIFKNIEDVKPSFSSLSNLSKKIDTVSKINYPDISMIILTPEYQAELDHSRDLLDNYKPEEALEFLEKLKSRIWSSAQPIVKYRILTNIGSAKLWLDQNKDAARLFIKALQYNPEDEKALCNAALGYMLLGKIEEAKTFANEVLTKNPGSSRAYSIIIQISPDDEKLEDVISKVPEPYKATIEVAHAIGYLARKRKKLSEAKKWIEIAIKTDKKDLPELKGIFGEILLELVIEDQSTIYGIQLNEVQKDQLRKSIELFSSAWNRIADTELRKLRLTWIVNRGIAKGHLGDLEGAIKDVETALEVEPSNPIFIKHRALLAYKSDDNEKAIELLKGILLAKETPEAALLLAEVLRKENKSPEAISILIKILQTELPKEIKEGVNRSLIQLYIDTKDFENACKISDSMRSSDPTNISNLVDAARISRFSGKSTDAISLLNEAKKYTIVSSSFRLLELADGFYFLEQFEDAADIYEKIVDKTLDTPLNHKLLNSYYRAGKIDKALKICQILHQKYGPLKYISEMESAIYEEIGNLPEAKRICQEYRRLFPDDIGMKLRLAVVNFRSNNFKELDKFLKSPIDIGLLSLESIFQLAYLYATRKLVKKSFEIMYETRRKFFNNGDAHLKYIGCFFQRERDVDKWLNVSEVDVNTAVCIKDDSGQRDWYIIEDRKDADIQRREINLDHSLAQKLLEKSVGDKILIKESPLSKEFGEIVEIKSKYVYALHESLSLIEKLFPDTPGFWGIRIEKPKKKDELPEGFQTILDEISRQNETRLKVEQFYKEGKLTVGALANLTGWNVLDVWSGIISKPDLGIKCCLGNVEERNHAFLLLNNNPKLIIDIISLMTLHGTNAEDTIIKAFGKLGIAQSTIDLLQYTINNRKGIQSKGFMTIGKERDKFVKQEISAEDVKRSIEYLESITHWIENNCEIIPCKAALDMKRDRKQQIDRMFGPSFIDTILIASETGNLLYSDDERLRSFAKTEFNVDGVWTQFLLMHCLNIKALERSKYNKMVIKLVSAHYRHTSIDADILIEAAEQAKWVPSQPYTTVLQILQGKSSNESSALIVTTEFLYKLWVQPILANQRDYLLLSLLDFITTERNRGVILDKLIYHIKRRFVLLPFAEKQILLVINIWKKMHIS